MSNEDIYNRHNLIALFLIGRTEYESKKVKELYDSLPDDKLAETLNVTMLRKGYFILKGVTEWVIPKLKTKKRKYYGEEEEQEKWNPFA